MVKKNGQYNGCRTPKIFKFLSVDTFKGKKMSKKLFCIFFIIQNYFNYLAADQWSLKNKCKWRRTKMVLEFLVCSS